MHPDIEGLLLVRDLGDEATVEHVEQSSRVVHVLPGVVATARDDGSIDVGPDPGRRCDNCRHWDHGELAPLGICRQLSDGYDRSGMSEANAEIIADEYAQLYTAPDFHCALFEAEDAAVCGDPKGDER